MVTPSSIMDHDRNEDGEISGEVHSPPPGGHKGRRSRRGAGTENGRTWDMCLYLGPWMEHFGVPGLSLDQSTQTPQSRVFADSKGSFLRGTGEGPGRQERLDYRGC